MSTPTTPTDEHFARAWREVSRPGWPSLQALREASVRYGIVRALAVQLAAGHSHMPTHLPVQPAPQAPAAAAPSPMRRRHDAAGPAPFNPRMAAAGEYVHPEE